MINPSVWLAAPHEVRLHLSAVLKLRKSGGVTVDGGKLTCDGHTVEDLFNTLTVPKLQEYTGLQSTDVYELFYAAVEKAKVELLPPAPVNPAPVIPPPEPRMIAPKEKPLFNTKGKPAPAVAVPAKKPKTKKNV